MEQINRQGNKNERKRMVFDFMIMQIKNRLRSPSENDGERNKDGLINEVSKQLANV